MMFEVGDEVTVRDTTCTCQTCKDLMSNRGVVTKASFGGLVGVTTKNVKNFTYQEHELIKVSDNKSFNPKDCV